MTLTESQAERVVGAFAAGADWALAARILSIPRSTLRRAIEADPGLMERVDDARAQADDVVIKSLYTKATIDKDTTAMIFWLKNRRPAEWRDRREHEMIDVRGAAERMARKLDLPVDEVLALAEKIAADAASDRSLQ